MPSFSFSEHEYSLNGGTTWTPCTSTAVNVGNVGRALNQVQVRVAATSAHPAGAVLGNATAFTVNAAPTISGASPNTGAPGTAVTLTGTDFTGATAVAFNGTAASFTVLNATTINTSVPAGAATGLITVITPGGTASSTGSFTVGAASSTAPVLSNLLPSSAAIGSNIQISGSNLTPTSAVKFGTIAATVVSATATSLTVTVPAGAIDSNVTVTTPQGLSNGLFFSLPVAAGTVPVNLLFVGNSIVQGTQYGGQPSGKVRSLCPASWTLNNRGHGGWGISLMTKNATAATRAAANDPELASFTADVEPYYNPSAGRNILIIQEGSNEIIDYENKVQAYIAARRAEGWENEK